MLPGVLFAAGFQQFPEHHGAINDFAGVLSPGVVQSMERIAIELEQKTGAAVVVVTMETIGDEDDTDYANRLYEAWGIGQKGIDRGVLILDVVDIRRIRLEIGYGLEGIIPDGRAGDIRDRYMTPFLRNDAYDNGLGQGFAAVAGIIARDAGVTLTGLPSLSDSPRSGKLRGDTARNLIPLILIILFILMGGRRRSGLLPLLIMGSMMGGGGRSWGGGFGGGLSGGGGAGGGY